MLNSQAGLTCIARVRSAHNLCDWTFIRGRLHANYGRAVQTESMRMWRGSCAKKPTVAPEKVANAPDLYGGRPDIREKNERGGIHGQGRKKSFVAPRAKTLSRH